jgi:hypothetical protein
LRAGLGATATLWPAIALIYGWVWRAAHILGEGGPNQAAVARQQLGGLLGAPARHGARLGALAGAAAHFVRASRSYWPNAPHLQLGARKPAQGRRPLDTPVDVTFPERACQAEAASLWVAP